MSAHDDPENRIEQLTIQIGNRPDAPEPYLRRGELYRDTGSWDLALADFERVRSLEPDHPTLNLHLGRLLLEAGRFEPAEVAIRRFLSRVPDHVEGRIILARTLRHLGRPLRAVADYEHALSLMPEPTPVIYLEQAEAFVEGGARHLDAAVGTLDEGIRRLGPLILLESRAVELEIERKRYDDALSRIDGILERLPRKEKWLAKRGQVLEQAERFDEARKAYADARRALEALPERIRKLPASRELEARLDVLLARGSP